MIKRIEIEGHPVDINTSAGWFFVYRRQFGRDVLPDLMPVLEVLLEAAAAAMEKNNGETAAVLTAKETVDAMAAVASLESVTILNIFWSMAANANKEIGQPEDFYNEFEVFPFDEVLPIMVEAVIESSVSKKKSTSLKQNMRIVAAR